MEDDIISEEIKQAENAYKDMYAKLYNVPRESLEDVNVNDLEQIESVMENRTNKVQFRRINAVNSQEDVGGEKEDLSTLTPVAEEKIAKTELTAEPEVKLQESSITSLPLTKEETKKEPISQPERKTFSEKPLSQDKKGKTIIVQQEIAPKDDASRPSLENNSASNQQIKEPITEKKEKPKPSIAPVVENQEAKSLDLDKAIEKLKAETAHLAPPPSPYEEKPAVDSKPTGTTAQPIKLDPFDELKKKNNSNIPISHASKNTEQVKPEPVKPVEVNTEKSTSIPLQPQQPNIISEKKQTPQPIQQQSPVVSTTNLPVLQENKNVKAEEPAATTTLQQPSAPVETNLPIQPTTETQAQAKINLPLGDSVTEGEKGLINDLASKMDAFKAFKQQPQAPLNASVPLAGKETGAVVSDTTESQPTPQPVLPTSPSNTNIPVAETPVKAISTSEQSLKQINDSINELVKQSVASSKELRASIDGIKGVVTQILSIIPSIQGNTTLAMQGSKAPAESQQINTNFLNNYKNEIRMQTGSNIIDINNSRSSIPGFTI